MFTAKSQIELFLREARELCGAGTRTLVPRGENRAGLRAIGITEVQAWEVVVRLTANNYHKGPEADDNGSEGELWFFGASVEGTPCYLKLKIEPTAAGRLLKCLSFHPARFPLTFPLRPR